jgi:hypothetical protein
VGMWFGQCSRGRRERLRFGSWSNAYVSQSAVDTPENILKYCVVIRE